MNRLLFPLLFAFLPFQDAPPKKASSEPQEPKPPPWDVDHPPGPSEEIAVDATERPP